jgi:hypothetical protein
VEALDLSEWLRRQCADFRFDLGGVFRCDSDRAEWPVHAASPNELEASLKRGGHLLPLPKESAALANVLEVSIVDFITSRLSGVEGAESPSTPETPISSIRTYTGRAYRDRSTTTHHTSM